MSRRVGLRSRKELEDKMDDMVPCSSNSLISKRTGLRSSVVPAKCGTKYNSIEDEDEKHKFDKEDYVKDNGEAMELDSDNDYVSEDFPMGPNMENPSFDQFMKSKWFLKQYPIKQLSSMINSPPSESRGSLRRRISRQSEFEDEIRDSVDQECESDDSQDLVDIDINNLPIDAILRVNRHLLPDGSPHEALIIDVNFHYSEENRFFDGAVIELNDAARKRSKANPNQVQTVYYVHYKDMDRRMDEWIDVFDISNVVRLQRRHTFDSVLSSALVVRDQKSRSCSSVPGSSVTAADVRSRRKVTFQRNNEDKIVNVECEKTHAENTAIKNIVLIQLGNSILKCWYFSPYPHEFINPDTKQLFICEKCLMYFPLEDLYSLHLLHCNIKTPPGSVIYSTSTFRVYEVVGAEHPFYCESLCLLSKLFLDHKTLYYNVNTFYFYVLCEIDEDGSHHLVGHFSKENFSLNNLACILVLPSHQRKGYGKLLIQLSYVFSIREGYIGTPEKPLSDLGKISYRGYWYWLIINVMIDHEIIEDLVIHDVSELSGIAEEDILITFEPEGMIKQIKGELYLTVSPEVLENAIANPLYRTPFIQIDPECIHFTRRYTACSDSEDSDCDSDDTVLMEAMENNVKSLKALADKYNVEDFEDLADEEVEAAGLLLKLDDIKLANNPKHRHVVNKLATSLDIPYDGFYDPLEPTDPNFAPRQLSQRHQEALNLCKELGIDFTNVRRVRFDFPDNYEMDSSDDDAEGYDFEKSGPSEMALTVDPASKQLVRIPRSQIPKRRRQKAIRKPSPTLVLKNGTLQLSKNPDLAKQKQLARNRMLVTLPKKKFVQSPKSTKLNQKQDSHDSGSETEVSSLPFSLKAAIKEDEENDQNQPLGDRIPVQSSTSSLHSIIHGFNTCLTPVGPELMPADSSNCLKVAESYKESNRKSETEKDDPSDTKVKTPSDQNQIVGSIRSTTKRQTYHSAGALPQTSRAFNEDGDTASVNKDADVASDDDLIIEETTQ